MGRRPKEKGPLTQEELDEARKKKAEYMKVYYKIHKERMIQNAMNRYWKISHGLEEAEIPQATINSLINWTKELEERIKNEELQPRVEMWILSQIKHNRDFIDGKQKGMGKDQEDWQL